MAIKISNNTIIDDSRGIASGTGLDGPVVASVNKIQGQWLLNRVDSNAIYSTENATAAYNIVTLDSNGSAQISIDIRSEINVSFVLRKNLTVNNPIGTSLFPELSGKTGTIRAYQDSTAGHTLSWGSRWLFNNGQTPVLTDSANYGDVFYYLAFDSDQFLVRRVSEGIITFP